MSLTTRRHHRSQPDGTGGPPPWPLRLLGPFVIATSLAVLSTGVMLAVTGPGNGPWLFLHKASFIVWLGCMVLHVLAHIMRLLRILPGRDGGPSVGLPGGATRWMLVAVTVLVLSQ